MEFHTYTTMLTGLGDPRLGIALPTISTTSTRRRWPMRSGSVPPVPCPTYQRAGLGDGKATLLQRVPLDHPDAHPAQPRPGFRLDPASTPRPLHPIAQGQEPAYVRLAGKKVSIRCMLLGDINDGSGISVLIDIGELMPEIGFPVYSYRNFRRQKGLTVENALGELKKDWSAEMGIAIPDPLINDCVRLCCTLCLLGDDSEVISPDVLADDRGKFEETGDQKYVDKARRRGKVGWDVGRQIEVAPHYRRPHMALVWTGHGRTVPKIVPRRGSIVHREAVEKVPMGFGEQTTSNGSKRLKGWPNDLGSDRVKVRNYYWRTTTCLA